MKWIQSYQLFLFDFDGLLVNTEFIHFSTYKQLLARYEVDLPWSFSDYLRIAHQSATAFRERIYNDYPKIKELDWDAFYLDKKKLYSELLSEQGAELMPGVEKLLAVLEEKNIQRCVVTHSPLNHIMTIRKQNPVLDTIPHWFTREDYSQPKPHPECYIKAIDSLADKEDKVIGFEDSPRGIEALRGTRAKPVLVAPLTYPKLQEIVDGGVDHLNDFTELELLTDIGQF